MKSIKYVTIFLLQFACTSGYSQSNTTIQNLDTLKPINLSDESWLSLKEATQEQILLASDGVNDDKFGFSVSIYGDRALISAPGTDSDTGAVYVYDLFEGVWSETAKLDANDKAVDDQFGYSVSLHGNRALISAYLDDDTDINTGSAYIFELSGDTWIQTAKLTSNDAVTEDLFGFSVSLYGDRALIGAFSTDDTFDGSGSAYVFDLSAGLWTQSAKLVSDTPELDAWLGYSVSLGEDRALLGARLAHADDSGAAYVFDFDSVSWTQTQVLTANDGLASDQFGYAVSLDGNRALIGAALSDDNAVNSGSAYIFDFEANNWNQSIKLTSNDATMNDFFGGSVSLSSDQALIGSILDDDNGENSGSAYLFDLSLGSWFQTAKLKASDGIAGDSFGLSVAISELRALVGANLKGVNDLGAAYVYKINQPPVALDDSLMVFEDSSATIISVLDNDTDNDAGIKAIISTTQASHGTVANSATLISYQPDVGYCNDNLVEDSFTYTLNGGSVATVTVKVICTFTISVTVTGLSNGNNVILQNHNGDDLSIFNNGSFVFSESQVDDNQYSISVFSQPNNPNQTCILSNNLGAITGSDVTDILLVCNAAPTTANDNYSTTEDSILDVVAGDLFNNDNDDEADVLSVANPGIYNTDGIGGLIFLESNGSFSYISADDLFGQSSFTYEVTDGINSVESTVVIDVQPVNDAPSFSILGNIDASNLLTMQNTQMSVVDFATNFVMGPTNESTQQLIQFNLEVYSDFNNVLNSVSMDNSGILSLDFTQNYGAAIIKVTMQDNGGTTNNGEDTSSMLEFIVSYTDLIYNNGFENNTFMKIFEYLDVIKLKSPYKTHPYYDYATDSIYYYGHSLNFNHNYDSKTMLKIVQYWVNEIFIKETK